jgi:hypothetical protein
MGEVGECWGEVGEIPGEVGRNVGDVGVGANTEEVRVNVGDVRLYGGVGELREEYSKCREPAGDVTLGLRNVEGRPRKPWPYCGEVRLYEADGGDGGSCIGDVGVQVGDWGKCRSRRGPAGAILGEVKLDRRSVAIKEAYRESNAAASSSRRAVARSSSATSSSNASTPRES